MMTCSWLGTLQRSGKKSTSMTFIHLENGDCFFRFCLICRLFRLQSSGKWSLIHREMIYKPFVVITPVLTFTGKGDTPKRYTCAHFILKIYIYIYHFSACWLKVSHVLCQTRFDFQIQQPGILAKNGRPTSTTRQIHHSSCIKDITSSKPGWAGVAHEAAPMLIQYVFMWWENITFPPADSKFPMSLCQTRFDFQIQQPGILAKNGRPTSTTRQIHHSSCIKDITSSTPSCLRCKLKSAEDIVSSCIKLTNFCSSGGCQLMK